MLDSAVESTLNSSSSFVSYRRNDLVDRKRVEEDRGIRGYLGSSSRQVRDNFHCPLVIVNKNTVLFVC